MKTHFATIFVLVLCLAVYSEAKPKKFESDFVFAEEEDGKFSKANEVKPAKNTWIHDPDNDLCGPLNCKKKELCLLETLYTAACVSKKELHRNGDIIISKSKYLAEEAKKKATAALEIDDDDDDDLDDDDEDDDLDDVDDDIFYDNDSDSTSNKKSTDKSTQPCTPCPVVKPTFLCGSDNRTYSSLCRLDYHNCIHNSLITISCKGFCPCKDKKKADKQIDEKYKAKENKLKENKIKERSDDEIQNGFNLVPTDVKYNNKHYKYITYDLSQMKFKENPKSAPVEEKNRGENEVIDDDVLPKRGKKECSEIALQAMGDRLVDWFSVIKASSKKRRLHKDKFPTPLLPTGCKSEVGWMFQHLDSDGDSVLSLQELYDLEHDENEHCIRPFMDTCDTDRDIFLTPFEWCHCFMKSERPCAAIKKRIPTENKGMYVPRCDREGYYEPLQCHATTGVCWCVTKHGVEITNSRIHGKVNCDLFGVYGLENDGVKQGFKDTATQKAVKNSNDITANGNEDDDDNYDDDDDDDDDDDTDGGSGDRPLEF